MTPQPSWLSDVQSDLDELATEHRSRHLVTTNTLPNHRIQVGDLTYLNFASNDYLGFGCDLQLHRQYAQTLATQDQLGQFAFTASASRLLGGEHSALGAFEALIGESYGGDRRALVFNSGYHANAGILPALAGRDDLILSDRLVHASLIDGIRLCRSQWSRYRHNDMEHLQLLLTQKAGKARRTLS